jgi:hypothetical protein
VLSENPLTASDRDLESMRVVATVVGGEVRYRANP